MQQEASLDRLMRRGSDFLGVKYPIMCGAMTWISDPALVSAVAESGCFGCLAGGNAPVEVLRQNILETRKKTDKPFAVNMITIAPSYRDQLAMVKEMRMPYIIFAGSFPKEKEVELAKESGAKVMCFASTESIAERMIRFGADAIILEGSESGGHIGHVSSTVLIQQVLFKFYEQIPMFLAGGMATGKMMAHALLMGGAGIQIGTRFVMTEECQVHPKFKEVFRYANARDAVATPQFDARIPVVAVRALRNKGTAEFGALQLRLLKDLEAGKISRQHAQEEVERFWMGALRRAAIDGDVENGSLMAGQSVGLVDKIMPIRELVGELLTDAQAELDRVRGLLA